MSENVGKLKKIFSSSSSNSMRQSDTHMFNLCTTLTSDKFSHTLPTSLSLSFVSFHFYSYSNSFSFVYSVSVCSFCFLFLVSFQITVSLSTSSATAAVARKIDEESKFFSKARDTRAKEKKERKHWSHTAII